ncbi:hypothetical protein ACJX0J_029398, partial [Zea mays]
SESLEIQEREREGFIAHGDDRKTTCRFPIHPRLLSTAAGCSILINTICI